MAVPVRIKLERLHQKHDARAKDYFGKAKLWRDRRYEASCADNHKRFVYCDERFDHWMNKAGREARICRIIEHQLKIITEREVA
jgi:hypothetical protein